MSSQPPAQTRARRQVFPLSTIWLWCALALYRLAALVPGRRKSPYTALPPPSLPTRTASSEFKNISDKVRRQAVSNDVLPDDVLLEIFDFYVGEPQNVRAWQPLESIRAWQSLVHVCRRWRSVVFGSARRLDLYLLCTAGTPARDALNVWPAFPLYIRAFSSVGEGLDNIIAVLERSDRVRVITLYYISRSNMEEVLAVMQVPFPELTDLYLLSDGLWEVVLPDSFLGGSAPRLQYLSLDGISFPGLPKLLLSATHLVRLHLRNIPHSGYISPDVMLTVLSILTNLGELSLVFQSPRSLPDRETRRPPPLAPAVLSVLTYFEFKGDSEYLDDLVVHIDTPRLGQLVITFFNQIVFDTPQLIQFIRRTPALKLFKKANVYFNDGDATVNLTSGGGFLLIMILCRDLDWQVSSAEQVCTSSLPPLSSLEDLYIRESTSPRVHGRDDIANSLWLELLHPFRAVKNLYLSEEFAPYIVPALQELDGSRATEVLPTLQNFFLEGLEPSGSPSPVQEGIQRFVATRQVTGDPIAVSSWD